uniref:Uncharacterized protein n=1 Tax=Meloidogyne javanica TaxID=6303 RepID=A0A915M1C7_MELJA
MLRPHLSSNPIVNDENFIVNQQQIKNCSRSPQPSILSANSDFVSPIPEEQQEPRRQWICGTQQSKLGSDLFRRECQVYEWLSKHKKIAIPRIFVIKKKWSKSCSALLLMEDLSDRARTGKITEGISAE